VNAQKFSKHGKEKQDGMEHHQVVLGIHMRAMTTFIGILTKPKEHQPAWDQFVSNPTPATNLKCKKDNDNKLDQKGSNFQINVKTYS
jgi:hypothetical protein